MAKGAPVAGGRMAERAIKRSDSRRAMTWPTGPWSGLSRCRAVFPRAHADEERIGARGRPLPGARQRACPMRSRRQPPPVWGPWPVGRHGPVASLGSIGFSPVMRLAGLPLSQVAGDRRDLCRASYGGPSTSFVPMPSARSRRPCGGPLLSWTRLSRASKARRSGSWLCPRRISGRCLLGDLLCREACALGC